MMTMMGLMMLLMLIAASMMTVIRAMMMIRINGFAPGVLFWCVW